MEDVPADVVLLGMGGRCTVLCMMLPGFIAVVATAVLLHSLVTPSERRRTCFELTFNLGIVEQS